MQNFINKINQIFGIITDSSLTPAQIIRCQKQLKQKQHRAGSGRISATAPFQQRPPRQRQPARRNLSRKSGAS